VTVEFTFEFELTLETVKEFELVTEFVFAVSGLQAAPARMSEKRQSTGKCLQDAKLRMGQFSCLEAEG